MRLLVCGSRDWTSYRQKELVWIVLTMFESTRDKTSRLTLIEGHCKGVDMTAYEWARSNQIDCLSYPADRKKGLCAGPQRNTKMIEEGKPDLVFVFTNDLSKSKGTRDLVEKAQRKGITVKIYTEEVIKEFYQNDFHV